MYDKRVRRRRAVLALLVVLSLILLTASFGSSGGSLHGAQRGVLQVLAPIQEGASRALKPFRDAVGWVGDTLHAKSQLATVRSERDRLRQEVIAAQGALTENTHLRNLVGLDQQLGLSSYGLVSARVIARAPTLWYATINVDRGSADGVRVDQPVITGEGLVGKVTAVSASAAQVTLITDHSSNVSAKVNETNDPGIIKADVGNPNDLVLDFLPSHSKVRRGDRVVTSGTLSSPGVSPDLRSLFPTGVPIGVVTSVDRSGVSVYPEVHVRPYVDLRRLDVVQILTRNVPGNQQASAP